MRTVRFGGVSHARNHAAILLAAGAAISVAAFASQAQAQFVWTKSSNGNFADTSPNPWLGGVAPIFSNTATLSFSPGFTLASVTATNDALGGPTFLVNNLTFNNINQANSFTLIGTGARTYQLAGTSPTLTLQGQGNHLLSGTGAALQLAADTTINGSGLGLLTINSIISETGGSHSLTIANTPGNPFCGIVTLGAVNTFTGGVVLDGGNMAITGINSLGPVGSSLRVTGDGGTLRLGGSPSLTMSTLQLDAGGTLRLTGSASLALNNTVNATTGASTFNTKLTGSGNLLIDDVSSTALVVASDCSAYTGMITVDRSDLPGSASTSGGIQVKSGSSSGTIGFRPTETGNLLGVSTINIRNGGQITLTNGVANQAQSLDRINDDATINLSSSLFNLVGSVSLTVGPGSIGNAAATALVDTTETVGTINAAGQSALAALPGSDTAHATNLIATNFNRVDRGTVLVRGLNLGADTANSGNVKVTNASTLIADMVGGDGSTGFNTKILPYAVGDIVNAGAGSSFVAVNGSGSFVPLAAGQYRTNAMTNADDNVRLDSGAFNNDGDTTLNSLLVTNSGVNHGSVTGAGTLHVTSGAILYTDANTASSISNNIAFGNTEAIISTNSTSSAANLTIAGNMTGTNGLTKSGLFGSSGGNSLILTGDNTGLTGTLTLNSGTINFNSASALPGTAQIVTNGAGSGSIASATGLLYSGATTYTLSRDVAAKNGWLTFKVLNTGGDFKIDGQISGNAGLVPVGHSDANLVGDGDIWLTNTNNTYTGPTNIASGTTHIASDGSLGNGGGVYLASTLKLEGDWNTGRLVNVNNGTVDTNGHNASINGQIVSFNTSGGVSNTGGLTKQGDGTLTITSNAVAFGGTMSVQGGTLLINGTIPGGGSTSTLNASSYTNPTTNAITRGTLGGTGTSWRNMTIGSTAGFFSGPGTLAPGNGGNTAGLLTEFGNLLFTNTSTNAAPNDGANIFAVDLNGALAGIGYDQMAVGGTATINNTDLNVSLGFNPFGHNYFILTSAGITGTFNGLAQDGSVVLGMQDFGDGLIPVTAQISYTGSFAANSITGGSDVVLYNIVPAPGAVGLLGLGGLLAARRRRR